MADFDSSLPIRTENDGDAVAKIVSHLDANNGWEILGTNEGVVTVRDPATGNVIAVNADGSINVNIVDAQMGDAVHVYNTEVAGVPGTENTVIDYTVTAGKTLKLKTVHGSASGKCKVEVKVGPTGSEVTQAVYFLGTADGGDQVQFSSPIEVSAGDKVLVLMTNRDTANQDLYAFINGEEV